MEDEKIKYYLKKLQETYPNKSKLNATEYCKFRGIGTTTFSSIIKKNELHKLPPFKCIEKPKKNGVAQRNYIFDIIDVAKFMAE